MLRSRKSKHCNRKQVPVYARVVPFLLPFLLPYLINMLFSALSSWLHHSFIHILCFVGFYTDGVVCHHSSLSLRGIMYVLCYYYCTVLQSKSQDSLDRWAVVVINYRKHHFGACNHLHLHLHLDLRPWAEKKSPIYLLYKLPTDLWAWGSSISEAQLQPLPCLTTLPLLSYKLLTHHTFLRRFVSLSVDWIRNIRGGR